MHGPMRKPASALTAAAAVAACACCPAQPLSQAAGLAAGLPPIASDTRLLVVAPHPDDETLCCAGVMQRVVRAGGRVSVVWITSGDAARMTLLLIEHTLFGDAAKARALGEQRMAEARAATALLGVPASGQLFLGYPDGGLAQLSSTYRASAYTSRTTGAAAVPYRDALFPGHPYTGESLERDFTQIIEQLQPTLILAPSPLDSHPDHRAAGLLTSTLSARLGTMLAVRYWVVHGGEGWPSPRGLNAGIPLTPAPLGRALAPVPFPLAPAEEDRKLTALKAYETQMRVLAPFLLAFVRTTELFSARATSDPQ
jgi:LmbE family N-acetylglucosaminyl deacetylase